MQRARTEVTTRAEPLPEDLDSRIQAARALAFEAERAGQDELAERRYAEAWAMLPEPRHRWDSSLIMALDVVDFHFKARRFDQALAWLAEADKAAEGSQNSQNLVWLGKIRFEQGRLDEAYAAFAEVVKTWRERPFRGEDPKYLNFYRSRTPGKKRS